DVLESCHSLPIVPARFTSDHLEAVDQEAQSLGVDGEPTLDRLEEAVARSLALPWRGPPEQLPSMDDRAVGHPIHPIREIGGAALHLGLVFAEPTQGRGTHRRGA